MEAYSFVIHDSFSHLSLYHDSQVLNAKIHDPRYAIRTRNQVESQTLKDCGTGKMESRGIAQDREAHSSEVIKSWGRGLKLWELEGSSRPAQNHRGSNEKMVKNEGTRRSNLKARKD